MSRLHGWSLAGALLLASTSAAAQPTADQCIDANEAGQDLQRSGHTRAARERFELCAVSTCPALVRDDCARRRAEVSAVAPPVDIVAPARPVQAPAPRPAVVQTALAQPAQAAEPAQPAQKKVAYVLGGAGALALGAGLVTWIVAKGNYEDARKMCFDGPGSCASVDGIVLGKRAHTQLMISNVAYVAGAVLVAGAAVLFVSAPKAQKAAASVAETLRLGGTW